LFNWSVEDCQLLHGDCRKFLFDGTIEPDSIDLTVTSPPYDNLRTYNNSSTWGWAEFSAVAAGLWHVTKPGGVVVWVVGDATIKGSETGTSLKQALFFKECGFNLHDTMVYQTNKPPTNGNRYNQMWEYMFVISKGSPSVFNPLKEKCLHPGVLNRSGNRTPEGYKKKRTTENRTPKYKTKSNIWYLPRSSKSGDVYSREHPATFPDKLAQDHIISWSNEGDIIFDPFLGSGTTGKMALQAGRKFIGCEIDKEYFDIAAKRIQSS